MPEYRSIKTYAHNIGLSCAFRQHAAQSHCRFLHGYALEIRIEFAAEELDACGWVVDFGGMKGLRAKLEATFDHKTVVALDDPQRHLIAEADAAGLLDMVLLPAVGCEAFAQYVAGLAGLWIKAEGYFPRVRVARVEVREHGGNAASYEPTP